MGDTLGQLFAVTSGKGGVGKSTVSLGLAFAFAKCDKCVLLIDFDEGLRCLDLLLGVDDRITFDLGDAFSGKDADECTYRVSDNVFLIPAPHKYGSVDKNKVTEFLHTAAQKYDVVIADMPAGIDFSLYGKFPKYTCFLTVCNPDKVSVRDAFRVCEELSAEKLTSRLVINRFDRDMIKRGIYRNIDEMIDMSGIQLIGIIPEDEKIAFLASRGTLYKKRRSQKAFDRVVKRLSGEWVKLPSPKKIQKGK